MNRYPFWLNALIVAAVLLGIVYALPNLFGEAPAVQISAVRPDVKVDESVKKEALSLLSAVGITPDAEFLDAHGLKFRFVNTDTQIHARDVLQRGLNSASTPSSQERYTVALNLISLSPAWLTSIKAKPMYLGLDLRGGVHFLLQVDMDAAVKKRLESNAADIRAQMRDQKIRYAGVAIEGRSIVVKLRGLEDRTQAKVFLTQAHRDLSWNESEQGDQFILTGTYSPPELVRIQEDAVRQNITTLGNRVNELGVAEPVIQQQGADRIVVQLPGVQDTAKAKEILGRTATLELRMVDENEGHLSQALAGSPPLDAELMYDRKGAPVLVEKLVRLTGDRLTDARQGFDRDNFPAVNLTLDAPGARIFKDLTKENIHHRMAILLIEKNHAEVVTAPIIKDEISGGQVQISGGNMTNEEAHDISLLLRAGALAAPMEIIEERTVGPSLGAENISRGFHSTLWGFAAIGVFMVAYYLLFGLISVVALSCNLILLIALLSLLQATLTLPGIAAIALTLGMAIDANVLINERIREELRNGVTPHTAISSGYERAFSTILDSNVTTLIAGLALLIFGSGPVRGFAVVHCLGILTSMFSAVLVSRSIVNFIHGKRRLIKLSIGQIWRGAQTDKKLSEGKA